MSEVNHVAIMLEYNRPSQRIIVPCTFAFHSILIIAYVATASDPAAAGLARFRLAIDEGTHAMVIETVRLHQVNDVKTVQFASFCICEPEVVPLRITTSVVIRLQNQIVFILVDLDRSSKISAFEP